MAQTVTWLYDVGDEVQYSYEGIVDTYKIQTLEVVGEETL